jgi:SNF2 family DNA or RNA helicase
MSFINSLSIVGLNLTMASKVICVDPWWNHAIEQQAFCRVFRIGQTQETTMTRFAVQNTIDEDIIRMQDRKQQEIDQIMESEHREHQK